MCERPRNRGPKTEGGVAITSRRITRTGRPQPRQHTNLEARLAVLHALRLTRVRLWSLAGAAALGLIVYLTVPGSLPYLLIGLAVLLHFGMHAGHAHQAHGNGAHDNGAHDHHGDTHAGTGRNGAGHHHPDPDPAPEHGRAGSAGPSTIAALTAAPSASQTTNARPHPAADDVPAEHDHGHQNGGGRGHRRH